MCVCTGIGIVQSWMNASLTVKWETETRRDFLKKKKKAEEHVLSLSWREEEKPEAEWACSRLRRP